MFKISIITVVYNDRHVLEKTILSVLNQTNSNYEYILVDGNSSDGTVDIIKKYESKIKEKEFPIQADNFRWISEPDTGLYDAMNKGIQMATGDFVWFINAGDKIYDDTIVQKITDLLHEKPQCDVVYGQSLIIDENDKPLGERHKLAPKKMTKQSLLNGLVVCHQSILVRRRIAPLYDLQYKVSADYDWVCKVLSISTCNCYLNQYISSFMVSGFSSVHRKRSWKERFSIMNKHFGKWKTFWAHVKIAIRYPFTRKY